MPTNIMGWDIGGAHLKAAVIQSPSGVVAVYQRPCQLWKGLDKLHESVQDILIETDMPISRHVLTMTGELVDLFDGRDDGVKKILAAMQNLLPNGEVIVYAGKDGLLGISEIQPSHCGNIASANWLASATWAAHKVDKGLFLDIGSTTTDILLLNGGKVLAQGYTDYERLISQELVYTGIVRTAVMAVAQSARDKGNDVGLMAEYFATMADVYRLTGELNEWHDQCETADGAGKTVAASAKRLARMIGCDYDENELLRWELFAANLRSQQLARIQKACEQQMKRIPLPRNTPLIGAGVGRFLVKQLAQDLGCTYLDFSDLFSGAVVQNGAHDKADCAAAVAVACLESELMTRVV
ncbi:H4MPT-linked C1 transfer pathway protein [Methyloglobulus morosus KoM1]|uniref:H4MPT-linked C1 transfer pathway protein n=1 Tax=Methyloglobulus morosus KoM1 TaxID=1116472 RepID=V5BV15_9GAMM|nr:hydantoinase/oxoprolinase family protein [Methyloglobulus morosus]ESS71714.1 H4MPT-linked C1 transfer pathway protein [Methyloglobulus morosus KoM1]